MFIYSIRSATIKFIDAVSLSVDVLVCLIAFIPVYDDNVQPSGKTVYTDIKNNSDRLEFISGFGWTVNEMPVEEVGVTIPEQFDNVFHTYNEIQKSQGLNLNNYRGKQVTRYTYKITNYEGAEGDVLISLLV